ncbi:MAG: hypothetical protein AABY10_03835 [Nanoarchaeota archaeon]
MERVKYSNRRVWSKTALAVSLGLGAAALIPATHYIQKDRLRYAFNAIVPDEYAFTEISNQEDRVLPSSMKISTIPLYTDGLCDCVAIVLYSGDPNEIIALSHYGVGDQIKNMRNKSQLENFLLKSGKERVNQILDGVESTHDRFYEGKDWHPSLKNKPFKKSEAKAFVVGGLKRYGEVIVDEFKRKGIPVNSYFDETGNDAEKVYNKTVVVAKNRQVIIKSQNGDFVELR